MVNNDKLYWVDTDAGVDDAVAILWALNNDFNIVGFSTVAGNLAVESTVRNVCALLEYSKKDIPVYYGASYATIGGHIDASHIHGVNLGPIVIDKDYKAKDIIEYMHKEKAYIETKPGDIIPFSLAKEIREF